MTCIREDSCECDGITAGYEMPVHVIGDKAVKEMTGFQGWETIYADKKTSFQINRPLTV